MADSTLSQPPDTLAELCRLVKTLRGDAGCPWDKKQSPQSVGIYLIEEVFELVDAIESGDMQQIREELGDVLFHIVFIARMFEERGKFDLSQVAGSITEKMIRRHPHVFGDKEVSGSAEVVRNWHKIKLSEKKNLKKQSLLDSVPAKLPALIRAYRISDRVAKSGFEWTEMAGIQKGVQAAAAELQAALDQHDRRLASRRLGALLFDLVNIARLAEIHPENALAGAVKEFEASFKKMEELAAESKRALEEIPAEEKKRIWQKAQQKML